MIKKKIRYTLNRRSKRLSRENLYELLRADIDRLNAEPADGPREVLNIGAGGEISEEVGKLKNCRIRSLDFDADRNPDIVADAQDLHMLADDTIDIVCIFEVLEHIPEPHKAVAEIGRVLKPGGSLLMSTPFILPIHEEPYDFYRYTEHGLRFLLRDFAEVRVTARNSYIDSIFALSGRMVKSRDTNTDKRGMPLFGVMLLLRPFFKLFDGWYENPRATTGYYTRARKA